MDLHDIFTNPPSPNDLLIGVDQFVCRGTTYPYSKVRSLRFFAGRIDHYTNFHPSGTTYETEFDIHLHGAPRPLRIRPQATTIERFYAEYSVQQQNAIRDAYTSLAEKTFAIRLQAYLDSLAQYGCFQYDGKRFFANGEVTDGRERFDFAEQAKIGKLLREPFKVYVELPKSLIGKVMHRLAQKDVGLTWLRERNFVVSTEYDMDVFFALMAQLYSVRWD